MGNHLHTNKILTDVGGNTKVKKKNLSSLTPNAANGVISSHFMFMLHHIFINIGVITVGQGVWLPLTFFSHSKYLVGHVSVESINITWLQPNVLISFVD